ncbi:MAG: LysR family transcriptional regulator [Pseudonocardiales bacterium]|nr:MAG: LysR family transcriptional regulator [Pseudonocardiales bacterium]
MEIRQLQILRELGELGSVRAVAEALYVTPSAISQQLRLLQATVAVPLTERTGRRLTLTDAGHALAAAASEVDTALARARHAVDAFIDDPSGTVRVAAFLSAGAAFFPPLIEAFSQSGTHLCLADEDVAQSEFAPLTGTYDIVPAHRLDHTPAWPTSVTTTALLHEPLDVAVPRTHRLADKQYVTPHDTASEPWITVDDGFPLFGTIMAISAAADRPLDVVHRINDFTVAGDVVAAGGGVALMPRWTTRQPPGVVLRPLAGVHARRRVDALCRPERTVRRSVAAVLDQLLHTAAQIQRA